MVACRYGTSLLVFISIPRDYNSLYSLARYFTRSLLSLTYYLNKQTKLNITISLKVIPQYCTGHPVLRIKIT